MPPLFTVRLHFFPEEGLWIVDRIPDGGSGMPQCRLHENTCPMAPEPAVWSMFIQLLSDGSLNEHRGNEARLSASVQTPVPLMPGLDSFLAPSEPVFLIYKLRVMKVSIS